MELRDYLMVARRRWRLVVTALLVVVALACVVTFRATPTYRSQARLFVSTTDQNVATASQGGNFAIQRVGSYADLVTGQQFAARVVDRLGLDIAPAALSSRITATVLPDTVLLEVGATDADPRLARRIAQATAQELSEFVSELETPPGARNAPIKATVVDSASLPSSPVAPRPVRNLGLAVILGLLLGGALALLRDLLDTSVKDADDLAELAGAPVLGGIPLDSTTPKQPLLTDLSPQSQRFEAFRILRTNLQFVDVDHHLKVFVVTSSVPGEGKTSTASNIALALQTAGSRTLLVDGDLRRPQLASLFGLEGSVGLTSVLLGRVDLAEAVQIHRQSGLSVLTSGSLPPNPAELLQSQAMRSLLEAARAGYDSIVIDSPPLLPVTDAALIATQADGAVVVVRQGRTTRDQVSHSMLRLEAVGARALGITLNMTANRGRKGYAYGYGYDLRPGAPDAAAGKPEEQDESKVPQTSKV